MQSQENVKHEIEVRTSWGSLLDKASPEIQMQQVDDKEVFLIDNVYSPGECERLLAASEEHGFGFTSYPKHYRGNLRLITTDESLADVTWQRLMPFVPSTVTLDGCLWDAVGLNECWRLAKYHPGDVFKGHCDASFQRPHKGDLSMFTVNIYMNEGFEGGSTRFYFKDEKAPCLAVKPKTGLCLLFRQPPGQCYYHDGERLGSGLKYLFRSDVMYQRRAN